MEYQDYYQTLGVPRTASQADIKKAFRKLAREHHPDAKPGDTSAERRFKAINEANAVLSDPEKRKKYDVLGQNWEAYSHAGADAPGGAPFGAGGPFGGFGGGGGNVRYEFRTAGGAAGSGSGSGDFSDFFRVFFGGTDADVPPAGRRARTGPGPSFEEILGGMGLGGATSRGGGASPGGRGAGGPAARPATTAEAVAEIDLEEAFHGTTRRVDLDGRRLDITIPKGADNGTKVKLSGQGPSGGDLVVTIRVRPHPVFTRRGADLEREVPVTLREALLGAEVPVTTLKGRVLLRIPAGTQPGHRIRLKGQGMPRLKGADRGDLYARVRVVLPTGLTPEAETAAGTFLDLIDQPDPR